MASKEEKAAQKALTEAAAITQQTTQAVLAFLKDLYANQRADQLPWLETGASANQKLAYLMGLSGGGDFLQGGSRRGGRFGEEPIWTGASHGITSAQFEQDAYNESPGYNRPIPDDPAPPYDPKSPPGPGPGPWPWPDDPPPPGPGPKIPRRDEYVSQGYASNPLTLIAGRGRASVPPSGGMVPLRAPTGEVRPVPAALVPHYLKQGAQLA